MSNQVSFGGATSAINRFFIAGTFSLLTTYQPFSVVFDPASGASYVALTTTVGNAVSNATYWQQMTASGGVSTVSGRSGTVLLVSSDLTDANAALGAPTLDASGFIKSAQLTTNTNAQVGTTYTIVAGDRGKLLTLNNASAVALTVPAASGSFAAGFFLEVTNLGAGLVTLTPTGTIDGAASLTLSQFQSITLTSVGGNWICLRSKLLGSVADLSSGTSAQLAAVISDETGSGALVFGTSPTIATPTLTGVTNTGNIIVNPSATGTGAALTIGGTSTTTGGISVFVGASGSQNERMSIVPADSSAAAVRVGALSVRTPAAGFLTGAEVASVSSTGAIAGLSLALGGGTALTTTNRTGTGNLVLATSPSVSDPTLTGVTAVKRLRVNQGTALVTGDVSGITNFGTTATCSAVTGTDGAGTISISSSGTGQIANGTFTLTFHDGAWTAAPVVIASRGDGNGPGSASVGCSASTTQVTFSFNGVPVAGSTYVFNFASFGK